MQHSDFNGVLFGNMMYVYRIDDVYMLSTLIIALHVFVHI